MDGNLVHYLMDRIESARKRVVVIGDAIHDVWVYGRMEECQDGCDKFIMAGKGIVRPGGASNAHQCLSHWDVNTDLIAVAERDRPTKTRFVADGKIILRVDNELGVVEPEWWMHGRALEMVGCAGAVLLSDYDKGFLTPDFIRQVATACRKRGVPCVADCKRGPELYGGCVLKCNSDYQRAHNQALVCLLFDAVEPKAQLVVTDGGMSPVVWDGGGPAGMGHRLPRVKCVNHVGAGDCFAAHLTLAMAYGFSLKDAAAIAHSAGRVYVQHPHNRAPYPAEVAADMSLATISTSTP